MVHNAGIVTDGELNTGIGFVGESYPARAAHFGYPIEGTDVAGVGVGGVANSYLRNVTLTDEQYGDAVLSGWVSGVYHAWIIASPLSEIGIGFGKTIADGYTKVLSNLTVADMKTIPADVPWTFPCEGTSGVPYGATGELPMPPHTKGTWGTPITISGNPQDKLTLSSGMLTGATGQVITLQLLDKASDPNHEVQAYGAVAYPCEPLKPLTSYKAVLTGTVNGKPFTRKFTFRTGSDIG